MFYPPPERGAGLAACGDKWPLPASIVAAPAAPEPCAEAGLALTRGDTRMDTHVKVLGILNIVNGVIGLCSALFMMVVFGGMAGLIAADRDPDAAVAVPIIGLTGGALVMVLVLVSLPAIIIGLGLFRFRPWARVWGIVLAILSLAAVPFGTIVGVYGLWVLLSSESERLFAQPGAAVG